MLKLRSRKLASITDAQRVLMRRLRDQGLTTAQIAAQVGLPDRAVSGFLVGDGKHQTKAEKGAVRSMCARRRPARVSLGPAPWEQDA